MPRSFRATNLVGVLALEKYAAVTPKLRICLLRTFHCLPWTPCAATTCVWGPASLPLCRGPSAAGAEGGGRFDPALYSKQVALLKSDLRAALAEVEAHEADIAAPVQQGAALALDELEIGLKDILAQVEEAKRQRHGGEDGL